MPCMCGDLCCRSCGPAQGSYRCDMCGKWTAEGGCDDPEACRLRYAELEEDAREYSLYQKGLHQP
jgi:hypothetical protein